jgi:ATP-dependent RNA helicase RhlE
MFPGIRGSFRGYSRSGLRVGFCPVERAYLPIRTIVRARWTAYPSEPRFAEPVESGRLGSPKESYLTLFSDLGLAEPLLQALVREGYETPTPIQAQAIPPVLAGRDLQGIAQTGTGKTAAFALPILTRLLADPKRPQRLGARVLVLAPTRELASQIADSFRTYGRHTNLHIAAVFGGVSHAPQIKALQRGLDVLVATPGRLVDHLDARNADLRGTEVLVLDEVDQMLDLGFVKAIRKIVGLMSARRQNLFFSATMPAEIGKLAAELLKDPVRVSVAPVATTVERVDQSVILVDKSRKRDVLVELFGDAAMTRAIVFTRTKHGADKVARHLEEAGVTAAAIHGNKSQSQRERSLAALKAGHVRALVATDIAARGIDVDGVTHVVNFDLPEVPEAYVHRIGRTARAGAEGRAISLCDHEEKDLLRGIEKLTRLTLPKTDRRTQGGERAPVAAEPIDRRDRRPPAPRPQNGAHGKPSRPAARPIRFGDEAGSRQPRQAGQRHQPVRG